MMYDLRRGSLVFRVALTAVFGLSIALPATAGVPLTGVGPLAVGTPLVTEAKSIHVNKNIKINKNIHVNKNVYVKRNGHGNKNVYVRNWSRKPYYGNVLAGVALGTILGVAAVGVAPPPPADNLCWYWTNPSKNRGYWDYCY